MSSVETPCKWDPELFWSADAEDQRAAMKACRLCPLLRECAEAAPDLKLSGGCVIASVVIPEGNRGQEEAYEQLAEIAGTGAAARPKVRRPRGLRTNPDFQAEVVALRDGRGMDWKRIASRVGTSYETAASAYAAYHAALGKTVGTLRPERGAA